MHKFTKNLARSRKCYAYIFLHKKSLSQLFRFKRDFQIKMMKSLTDKITTICNLHNTYILYICQKMNTFRAETWILSG